MGRQSSCVHIASPASRAVRPSHTQRIVLSTSGGRAGDQDSKDVDQCIAATCQLALAAPRLAQLMAAPGGALHQLTNLAFAACNVQTVLRIMHSFAHALPDPQARGPPQHLAPARARR